MNMRRASWFCLPAACLLAGLAAAPADARSVSRTTAASRTVLKKEFTGYGVTAPEAQQHALEQARDWLADKNPFGWAPPLEYLTQKSLVRFAEPSGQQFELAGPMQTVKMDLEVNAVQAEDMQKIGRQQRTVARALVVGRVLVGLVALLVVFGGYLKLEEATRGYYTALLRAAALTILALVGAGLWLFS
jgi:hypothetical protein